MLTIADLDKIDALNDEVISAIKASGFAPQFEVFVRSQFAAFIGELAEDYNANTSTTCH